METNAPKKSGLERNIDIVNKKVDVLRSKKSILEKQRNIQKLGEQIGNKRNAISKNRKELSKKQRELSKAEGPGTMIITGIVVLILALILSSFMAGMFSMQTTEEQ
jgi:ABC-type Na+ efflux pump permease subunit